MFGNDAADSEMTTLRWEGLTYTTRVEKKKFYQLRSQVEETTVLDRVSGEAKGGTLTAVIGLSGSGKTTLLAAISQRIRGNIDGQVYLNDRWVSSHELRSCSAYVPQADMLLDTLTPLEHLRFLAKLKFGNRTEEKILDIFMQLGLFSVSNSRIASLSGGQRRKLMLAAELLHDPKILICDEPTTGLDSFSALSVIKTLRKLTGDGTDQLLEDLESSPRRFLQPPAMTPRIVMCSIHQPSSEVFQLFTNVILMQSGKIVFQGSQDEVANAFSRAGLSCPYLYNPAEHYVRMSSKQQLKLTQKKVSFKREENCEDEPKGISLDPNSTRRNTCWWNQTCYLMQRTGRTYIRNYQQHLIESTFYLFTAFIIGLLYQNVKPTSQESIQDVNGALFTMATEMIFSNAYFVVYLIPSQMPLLRREVGENLYSLSAFYISRVLLVIPKILLETTIFTFIVWSFTATSFLWTPEIYFKITASLIITSVSVTAYGFLLSGLFESIRMTLEMGPPLDFFFYTLGGIFINIRTFPYLKYISMFYFANEAILIEYWKDVEQIDCPDYYNVPCIRNGTEVLESYGFGTTNQHVLIDHIGLVVWFILGNIAGYFGIRQQVKKHGFY